MKYTKKKLLLILMCLFIFGGCGSKNFPGNEEKLNDTEEESFQENEVPGQTVEKEADVSYIDQFLQNEYEVSFLEKQAIPNNEAFQSCVLTYCGNLQNMKSEYCRKNNCNDANIYYEIGKYNSGEEYLILFFDAVKRGRTNDVFYMIQKEDGLYIAFGYEGRGTMPSFYQDGVVVFRTGYDLPMYYDFYSYISPTGELVELAEYESSFIDESGDIPRLVSYEEAITNVSFEHFMIDGKEYGYISDDYNESVDLYSLQNYFCKDIEAVTSNDISGLIDEYAKSVGCHYLEAIDQTMDYVALEENVAYKQVISEEKQLEELDKLLSSIIGTYKDELDEEYEFVVCETKEAGAHFEVENGSMMPVYDTDVFEFCDSEIHFFYHYDYQDEEAPEAFVLYLYDDHMELYTEEPVFEEPLERCGLVYYDSKK